MATLHNKEECGKEPKKTFAPPKQKLHSLMPISPSSPKEETLGVSYPTSRAGSSPPNARLKKKEEKVNTENGPGSGQEKKGKDQGNKRAEKKAEKEKASLTNAEFEEIVQIVLRKSLQECLGMTYGSSLDFVKTSSAQSMGYVQSDKEPGIASTTTAENDNADGERLMVLQTPEISASQEDRVVPEINTSEPSLPDPVPSKKKFNRFFLNERKKESHDEKMEKVQGRPELRENDQLKKMVQDHFQTSDQQKGVKSGFGQCLVWVQCSSPNCEKWRQLRGNIDPSVLPDNWSCDQNTDLEYNRCDIPEETWTGPESDVAYASYIPGSIIWAKQYGYPWWPGMVESDPDLGEYFLFASHLDSLPSKYHVTFFGETVSRAWIPVNMLKNFQEMSLELAGVGKLCQEKVPCLNKCAKDFHGIHFGERTKYWLKIVLGIGEKCRNKDCSQKLGAALIMAQEAEQISIQERVNLFGFWSRYGSNTSGEGKDLIFSGPNSPDFFLDKEEESESEMEVGEDEEEEKKDPTLPGPKPAKIQPKKLKRRGMAEGKNRTPQRKMMKRSLGEDSTARPPLTMGRKEGQENSDPEHPGPKKKFKALQSRTQVTCLSEEKGVKMMPKGPTAPAPCEACPVVKKASPGPQEPPNPESGCVRPEDKASSDLDLEQLIEDTGKEPEQREEPQGRDEESPMTLFEE